MKAMTSNEVEPMRESHYKKERKVHGTVTVLVSGHVSPQWGKDFPIGLCVIKL